LTQTVHVHAINDHVSVVLFQLEKFGVVHDVRISGKRDERHQ
jgi:hypothetical protein